MSTSLITGELEEYDPSINMSKPTSAFIDLSTFGNIDSAMYGGPKSITYFIRETVRSTWFTQIPIKLKLNTASPGFNSNFKAKVSRSGDYLLNAWLRVTLDAVSIYNPGGSFIDPNGSGCETLIWTPNFMHNLIETCSLKVNDMKIDELFSEHLDFYSAFMISKGRRVGYNRMIGNFTSPNNGLAGINVCGIKATTFTNLNTAQELFLPLSFFFSKNPSLSLPMAALPYSDIQIDFKFRPWNKLLASIDKHGIPRNVDLRQLRNQTPTLSNIQVWGNYAIVSNEERQLMGCNPKDMIIEQSQQVNGVYGSGILNVNSWNNTTSVDLRLNGAVKALFFGARNQMGVTESPFRSNYTTSIPSASDILTVRVSSSGTIYGFINSTLPVVVDALLGSITTQTSGASDATYSGVDSSSDRTGTGAIFDVEVSGGVVTVLTVVTSGIEYTIGEKITIASADIGNGGNLVITLIADDLPPAWTPGERALQAVWESRGKGESMKQIPPVNYNMNWYNNEANDYSGLYWGSASSVEPVDPIGSVKLLYENSIRMDLESNYYSLIQPFYHAKNVPDSGAQYGVLYTREPTEVSGQASLGVGYHMYSYALKLDKLDPCGSTNYEVLTNSSLVFTPSKTAVNSSLNGYGPWSIFISAVNSNILRVSGGSIGFPVL